MIIYVPHLNMWGSWYRENTIVHASNAEAASRKCWHLGNIKYVQELKKGS